MRPAGPRGACGEDAEGRGPPVPGEPPVTHPERPTIRVLPPDAAERIAAGEVVERPASVVKELVENSLDAGARRIVIEVEKAGLRLIRVTDDGEGIPARELGLAFERFATSKIRSAEDLRRVRTYGFRGEALPSIAAVARVTVETCARGEAAGAELRVVGGDRGSPVPRSRAEGTTVTVEDLFFNTPARRAFLKSERSELALVVATVEALALAAPEVAFRLLEEGREVVWAPPESFVERAQRILGVRDRGQLLLVEARSPSADLVAVLGTPQLAQRRRTLQWFLVNGRPVRSPLLARALDQAYHTLVPEDRYPVAVLSLRVRPEDLDVNVHPRKAEVRFARERDVFDDVVRELSRALRRVPLVPVVTGPSRADPSPSLGEAGAQEPLLVAEPGGKVAPSGRFPPIRVMGQIAHTYIVGESEGDLLLLDQHAAHERVLYERLLARRRAGAPLAQALLVPVVLELTASEAEFLAEARPAFEAWGFEVEPFGPRAVRLRAVPEIAAERRPAELFRACLHDLREDVGRAAAEGLEERVAIATACHTAIRAGDRLSPEAMAALVADLARTEDPFSCFHGRPTLVRVRVHEIERWFYRKG